MSRFLILVLEAPLLAFGCESVDWRGPVSDFPGASMLTGLLANAFGWRRTERDRHARLQQRLRFAARIDQEGERIRDFQTAELAKPKSGWTTRGVPEGPKSGESTERIIRKRDYDAGKRVTVALHFEPSDESPTLDEAAAAIQVPARPLFLGRKSCLPSRPLFEADDLLTALAQMLFPAETTRVLLPASVPAEQQDERMFVSDLRNWRSGVHGGQRELRLRRLRGKSET